MDHFIMCVHSDTQGVRKNDILENILMITFFNMHI